MEENNNQEEKKECNCQCNTINGWLKLLMLFFAVMLGSFLAVYFVVNQTLLRAIYPPFHHHDRFIQKMIDENSREMKNFERQMRKNTDANLGNFSMMTSNITELKEDAENYELVINLSHFNNNIDNIKLDLTPDKISILGVNERDEKNSIYSLNYSQTFRLNKKIDTKNITKEVVNNKAIIYLPFAGK